MRESVTPERPRRPSRAMASEQGFTIVEVLVAALVVALTSLGTFAAFDAATKTSGNNKARSVASSLAQSDQERIRSLTPAQLLALSEASVLSRTSDKTVDRRVFTVTSAAIWTSDPGSTSSCAGLGSEPGWMKITSTVTWPDSGAIPSVEADSTKAVPNGGFRDSRGSLAVRILDRLGNGVAGTTVTATGPRTYSMATNAQGCVLFGFVPVGDYTVSFSRGGYVEDLLDNPQAISDPVTVEGEQTSSAEYAYDRAGAVGVLFRTGTGTTTSTGDGFTVVNLGMGFPNRRSFGLLGTRARYAGTGLTTAAVSGGTSSSTTPYQKVLFPFTDTYSVYAGTCPEAEPTQYSAAGNAGGGSGAGNAAGNGTALVPAGGAVGSVVVRVPTMGIKVVKSDGTVTSGSYVIRPSVGGCTGRVPAGTGVKSFSNSATVNNALPYGNYTVCVQDSTVASARRTIATVQNRAIGGSTPTSPASNTIKLPLNASTVTPPCS